MTIDEVMARIGEVGIVPVVRSATVEEATRAVEAICAGGIPVVEITMTVPDAVSVIREVAQRYAGTVLIGAGTVTTAVVRAFARTAALTRTMRSKPSTHLWRTGERHDCVSNRLYTLHRMQSVRSGLQGMERHFAGRF